GSESPPPLEQLLRTWETGSGAALDARLHFANFRAPLRLRPTAPPAGAKWSARASGAKPKVRVRNRSRSRPSLQAPRPRHRVRRVLSDRWSDRPKLRRRRNSREPEGFVAGPYR